MKTLQITLKVKDTKNGPVYQWIGTDGFCYSKPFGSMEKALAVCDWMGKGLKKQPGLKRQLT